MFAKFMRETIRQEKEGQNTSEISTPSRVEKIKSVSVCASVRPTKIYPKIIVHRVSLPIEFLRMSVPVE